MKPGGTDRPLHLGRVRGREALAQRVGQLDLVHAVVPAHHHHHQAPLLGHHRIGLEQGAGLHAERARHLLHRRLPRGVDPLGRIGRRAERYRRRLGGCDLQVGRVAGGEHHLVLARRARRHVLVGPQPAHHPHVGLHPVPLQAAAVQDAVVGADVLVVASCEAVEVAIEGVGVLHHELARAQHPGAGSRLVALLDLEVVEDQRQVAVGAHHLRDVEGDHLLVGHGQHHLRPAAIGQLEQLVDLVATRASPRLGRLQHRHQHLLAADGVDLLTHDPHRLLVHTPAGGQPGPQASAHLAHQPRPHHQLVREGLGIGRGLALGGQQVVRLAGHARKRRATAWRHAGRRRRGVAV